MLLHIMKCAECMCIPQYCNTVNDYKFCALCKNDAECCCILIHNGTQRNKKNYLVNNANLVVKDDDCCSKGTCNDDTKNNENVLLRKTSGIIQFSKTSKDFMLQHLGLRYCASLQQKLGKIWASISLDST